jgi:hypothetical protein
MQKQFLIIPLILFSLLSCTNKNTQENLNTENIKSATLTPTSTINYDIKSLLSKEDYKKLSRIINELPGQINKMKLATADEIKTALTQITPLEYEVNHAHPTLYRLETKEGETQIQLLSPTFPKNELDENVLERLKKDAVFNAKTRAKLKNKLDNLYNSLTEALKNNDRKQITKLYSDIILFSGAFTNANFEDPNPSLKDRLIHDYIEMVYNLLTQKDFEINDLGKLVIDKRHMGKAELLTPKQLSEFFTEISPLFQTEHPIDNRLINKLKTFYSLEIKIEKPKSFAHAIKNRSKNTCFNRSVISACNPPLLFEGKYKAAIHIKGTIFSIFHTLTLYIKATKDEIKQFEKAKECIISNCNLLANQKSNLAETEENK